MRAFEEKYLERFIAAGATVFALTVYELAAFVEECKPVYDWMRSQIGDEMVDKWLATVPK